MRIGTRTGLMAIGMALGVGLMSASEGAAENARGPVAPLILDLVTRPMESYDAAFNQSMREAGPRPRRAATEGRVLPDGSVQYGEGPGSVVVTLRNPCPEGSGHYDAPMPPPLPGRRPRN